MSSEADIIGHIHKVLLPHFQQSPIESLVALVLNILNESSMDMLLARMGSETDIINTWAVPMLNICKESLMVLPFDAVLRLFMNLNCLIHAPCIRWARESCMFSRHWALTVSWRHPICDQLWLLFSGERRHPYRSGKRKAWYVVSTTDECYVGVSCAVRYFDVVLMHRLSRPTNVDVHMWCISAFGSSNEKLMLLSKLYLQLETVELRWCPFN
jgi:hypothetical protein